jgi:hypothetical protein
MRTTLLVGKGKGERRRRRRTRREGRMTTGTVGRAAWEVNLLRTVAAPAPAAAADKRRQRGV